MPPRTRNLFNPESEKPYKLSRTRLERFLECPRCFFLDRRLGIDRVSGPAFTLNSATDTLLKKEFKSARDAGRPHRLIVKYGIDALPFDHPNLETWMENFKGVEFLHRPTNFIIHGAVDDIWINSRDELLVVDYKSTSTTRNIDLNDEYKKVFIRQMEIYQWLLRQNGFTVSDTGYFVYVNADTGQKGFEGKLVFDEMIIPHSCNASWVEQAVSDAKKCLMSDVLPTSSASCEWCAYREGARSVEVG